MFKKVATVARLKKKDLKKPDKQPRTYDQRTFSLDRRMDMEIQFGDKIMKTAVYIKMDAHEQLLHSEGVSRQLVIITNHSDVNVTQGSKKHMEGKVTTLRVKRMQSVQLSSQ